jgi:hypothetical protein
VLALVPASVLVPELATGPVAEAVSWQAAQQAAVAVVSSHIQRQRR